MFRPRPEPYCRAFDEGSAHYETLLLAEETR
jgi:hypothetical protein